MHKAIFQACTLLLLAACHPAKANTALLLLNASLSVADSESTYSTDSLRNEGFIVTEKDPVTRPFVALPKPANLSLAIGGDVFLADIGLRMRRSQRWFRRLWWLPQVAVAAGNAWGVTNNVRLRVR